MRREIVKRARAWLGTPYLAGASQRGVATDCAGLIEGLARELNLACPSRSCLSGGLLEAVQSVLLAGEHPFAGDVILLAQTPGGEPVHAGLMVSSDRFIHAHWTAGVVENRYGRWFQARTCGVFIWPETPQSTPPVLQEI